MADPAEPFAEKAQSRWAAKHYTKPCDSCGARAGEPCRTASGYVTMRHASRRRADASTPPDGRADV